MDVLVIEDEAPLREFEAMYLRDAGYGTIKAADDQAAVELFVEHQPDLAIIDYSKIGVSSRVAATRYAIEHHPVGFPLRNSP